MSHQAQFAGQGALTQQANQLLPHVGMTLLARFDANPAPMTQRLLDEVRHVARSTFEGPSFFELEISGTAFLWAVLAVSELEGGFVFFGLPPREGRTDPAALRWTRELIDWLKFNTSQFEMASLGETESAEIATFTRRAVPIPAIAMIQVLNGELS